MWRRSRLRRPGPSSEEAGERIGRSLSKSVAEQAGRAYIVGPELSDAIRACRALDERGIRSTIGFWNRDDADKADTARRYADTIDAVGAKPFDALVSVKAPSLGFSAVLFRSLMERARDGQVVLRFDSLGPETADPTFDLVGDLVGGPPGMGCTLPGRWRRSLDDADRAIDLGLHIRIVKGQWPDVHGPEIDPRAGFLHLIDRIAGRARRAAVATHDAGLAREALRRLRAAGTPCELELLFGLPFRDVMAVAEADGVPVRVYLPYGHGSLPYAMRQVRQNPGIAWRIIRDLVGPPRRLPDFAPTTRASNRQGIPGNAEACASPDRT